MTRTERTAVLACFALAVGGFALAYLDVPYALLLTVPGWVAVGWVIHALASR